MGLTLHRSLAVAAALAVLAPLAAARPEEPAVVEITAKRFQFTPSEVTLERGKPVVLRLHSEDVTHGFYMKALGIDTVIPPGRNTDVAITPQQPGRYMVICDHFCGAGHGNMHMDIVVK